MTAAITRPYWHGMLCAENLDEVAERMRAVLDGEFFTLVCCNSYSETSDRFTSVEVYPSQRLSSPIVTTPAKYAGINWSTPRLSMGFHTRAKTQQEARSDRPHGYVHLTFEPREIKVDHYAPAGYRLLWIFAVENHLDES